MSEERRVCVTHRIDWPCPSCALHSAEREVLEAAVAYAVEHFDPHSPERNMADNFRCGYGPSKESVVATDGLRSAVRRYRALLDKAKTEGKEA